MCPQCLTMQVDNLWIEDCETNDLIGRLYISDSTKMVV